jgi:hypothetical protein
MYTEQFADMFHSEFDLDAFLNLASFECPFDDSIFSSDDNMLPLSDPKETSMMTNYDYLTSAPLYGDSSESDSNDSHYRRTTNASDFSNSTLTSEPAVALDMTMHVPELAQDGELDIALERLTDQELHNVMNCVMKQVERRRQSCALTGTEYIRKDVRPEGSCYVCIWPGCYEKYQSLYAAKRHFSKHDETKKKYECQHCGKRFGRKDAYDAHENTRLRKGKCCTSPGRCARMSPF